jgi:predicted dienelactone hydrolase
MRSEHFFVGLGLVWIVAACGGGDEAPPPALSESGPFRVGYRTLSVDYMPEGTGGLARTIPINVWYPTNDLEGTRVTYAGLFIDADSWRDATLAPPVDPAGYPVHVYSHGHRGFGGTSAALMRHFASHGWVAVAPDHTGNTFGDFTEPNPTNLYFLRSMDISQSLDALESLPSDDPLAGHLQTERVLMSGHSFGVTTTWASAGATYDVARIEARCEAGEIECTGAEIAAFAAGVHDARVVAAIGMAGALREDWFGSAGYETVSVPFFAMSGILDDVGADAQFAEVTGMDLTWIDIEGGCHQAFALGGCDAVADEVVFPIINEYALAFGRRHVLVDARAEVESALDGSREISDLVTFQKKEP